MKARLNNLPLNYRSFRAKQGQDIAWRRCAHPVECQAHIFNQCKANPHGPTRRHNSVLNALGAYLKNQGFNVDIDVSPTETNTSLRPDLIIRCPDLKKIFLIDIKTPYDNIESFSRMRKENKTKYDEIANQLARSTRLDTIIDCIVVGSLGSWDPENDIPLKRLAI